MRIVDSHRSVDPLAKPVKGKPWSAAWLALAVLTWAGCGGKESQSTPTPTNTTSSGNPVTAPVDYLGAVSKAQQSAVKTTGTLGLQQAINQFQIQEGRFPKDLNELVSPDYLSRLPPPPARMKYDYNPATGQVKVVPDAK